MNLGWCLFPQYATLISALVSSMRVAAPLDHLIGELERHLPAS